MNQPKPTIKVAGTVGTVNLLTRIMNTPIREILIKLFGWFNHILPDQWDWLPQLFLKLLEA